jgi:hypothetical protein
LLDVDVEIRWDQIVPDDETDDETEMDDDEDAKEEASGAGGIFELEDIEKTIEQELVRQAAAWERGGDEHPGTHGGAGEGKTPTIAYSSPRPRRGHGHVRGLAGLDDGAGVGARGQADRRWGRARVERVPGSGVCQHPAPGARVKVYAIFGISRVRSGGGGYGGGFSPPRVEQVGERRVYELIVHGAR